MKAGIAQSGRTILAVFAAISLLLSLMAVYAMPADADHDIEPELIEDTGNQTCTDLQGDGQEWIELKQDDDELGEPTLTDGTLTVEISNFDGKSFDWSSNIGVDAVFVKAGAEGSYLYRYDPPHEETSDTGLTTPGEGNSNEISHIAFCYDLETKIIVEKVVTDGDKELAFTFDTEGFDLKDNTLSHNQSSSSDDDLDPGEYSVTEQVPAGWTLDSVECTNQDQDTEDNEAIDLTEGEVVTCVFTNSEDPGEIIVVKEVTEGSDTSQSFDFTADYDSDGFSLADGEQNNSGELKAGTYAVSESVPSGWTLQSSTCDDDSDPSNIDLAAGETVTCTFVNDETPPPPPEPGVIIVEKEVTEGSDTTQSFDFTADYGSGSFSLADGESNNSGELDAGTYAVSETVPTGWTLESSTCDDGSDPSSIDLGEGETVTCTFVNDETPPPPPPEPGEIVVVKQVLSGDTTHEFDFTASYDADGFSLADGESNNSGDLDPGIYTVTEEVPVGWVLNSETCDNGDEPGSIELGAGEIVTCTFVNIGSEVGASIVVTVAGSCELDGDEGEGVIDVEISVDGGADVVISDSDGDVIDTLTSSGTVTVPEGATYTWEATPNEGFEFPEGSETSGSITIETCSDDPETLPFTGLDTGMMSLFGTALLGGGLLLVTAMRRQEEA